MAEPASTLYPVAVVTGVSAVSIVAGLDNNAVVAAFAGALMFAFVSSGTGLWARVGMMMGAWVFGYYAGMEFAKRQIWDFDSPPLPSFVAAFFCVVVFKTLLAVFNEDGKTWIRKKLGLPAEGSKDE